MTRKHVPEGSREDGWRKHPAGDKRKNPQVTPHPGREEDAMRQRTRLTRGFTLLELAVALGVFVVFAVATATVTISATGTHSQLRFRTDATNTAQEALSRVAVDTGYAALVAGDVKVPDEQRAACSSGEEGCTLTADERAALERCIATIEGPREGCILLGSRAAKLRYSVENMDRPILDSGETHVGAVKIIAEGTLPNGRSIRAVRKAVAPSTGFSGDSGYVEVVLAGDLDGLYGQKVREGGQLVDLSPTLRVLSHEGTVLDEKMLDPEEAAGRALLRISTAEIHCTQAEPCKLEIEAGRFTLSDRFENSGGSRIVVDRGSTTRVAAQLTSGPGVIVTLSTRPQRDPLLSGSPELGSVCLWGTFEHPDVPGQQVYTSWCNINSPFEVEMRGWNDAGVDRELPSSAASALTIWVNPPVPLAQQENVEPEEGGEAGPVEERFVDCTPGTTPGNGIDQVDERMRAWQGSWVSAETCTGWTWGMPTTIAFSSVNEVPYLDGQTAVGLQRTRDRRITLIWEPATGSPAAGCAVDQLTWANPRSAPAPLDYNPDDDPAASC